MNQKENIYVLIPKQKEEINLKDLEKFLKILQKERVKKYYAYVKELDKKNCILSYLLLCYILNKDYDIFITPKFKYGKNKKPYFENIKKLYFNLSHSNNKIAGAVSDCNIGIDIQEQRKISKSMIKRVLNEKELDDYLSYTKEIERKKCFCRLWTIKESEIKRRGSSVLVDLKQIEKDNIKNIETFEIKDFCISISSEEYKEFNLIQISTESLLNYFERGTLCLNTNK